MPDLRGILFNKGLRIFIFKINSPIYSFIVKLLCYLKGVELGKRSSFYGFTNFYRAPNSYIKIGAKSIFLSKPASNLIGINHRCIISTLQNNAKIVIGKGCGFSGVVIGAAISISLGDNVRCGANTLITDCDWHLDDPRSSEPKPIKIGNNVWLGVNSVILKGVSIGENSVVGANSVVTKSIPANVIAAGNPCKVLRML